MTPENLVDAALAGLDQGEVVTIPVLQDGKVWDNYEAARRAMSSQLGGYDTVEALSACANLRRLTLLGVARHWTSHPAPVAITRMG